MSNNTNRPLPKVSVESPSPNSHPRSLLTSNGSSAGTGIAANAGNDNNTNHHHTHSTSVNSPHISRLIGQYEQKTHVSNRSMSTNSNSGAVFSPTPPENRRAAAPQSGNAAGNNAPAASVTNSNRSRDVNGLPPPLVSTSATPPSSVRSMAQRLSNSNVSPLPPAALRSYGSAAELTNVNGSSISAPPSSSTTAATTSNVSPIVVAATSTTPSSTVRRASPNVGGHPNSASIRHKLQSFRTLPMNLPSTTSNLAPAAATMAPHSANNEELKTPTTPLRASSYSPPTANSLSPTHFSYWEKRNIWVQREQEEMRAKHNLKKVLRKINDSNLIVKGSPLFPLTRGLSDVTNGEAHKTSPVPPAISPLRATSQPLRTLSPSSPTKSEHKSPISPGAVAMPSPNFPAITISELSAAASRLNLTGQLGSVSFVRDCAAHLSKMEHSSCKFTDAPQLMWALKALTLNEQDFSTTMTKEQSPSPPQPPMLKEESKQNDTPPRRQPPPLPPNESKSSGKSDLTITPSRALTPSEAFQEKKRAIERIITEQHFAPPVVQYIRAHALIPPLHSGQISFPQGKDQLKLLQHAGEPGSRTATLNPKKPPPLPAFHQPPQPPPFPMQAMAPAASVVVASPPPHSVVGATLAAPAATTDSASSTRSNSLATELDHEWHRRHIPKVKLKNLTWKVDEKLNEEAEELEEKKRLIVQKLLALKIWDEEKSNSTGTTGSASSSDSFEVEMDHVLSSLKLHRFDLLRFTFELTELSEMEGRNIHFANVPQALVALKLLYEKHSPEQFRRICEQNALPSHVQAYLEARRNEIINSRDDTSTSGGAATRTASSSVDSSWRRRSQHLSIATTNLAKNGAAESRSHSSSVVAAAGGGAAALSTLPISPVASPIAHHRSISLVGLLEVLHSGNLLETSSASGPASPRKTTSAESLSWKLSDVGLDVSEISIDDLIQMQQNPRLIHAFSSVDQVVSALSILYTDLSEAQIETEARKQQMAPKIVEYLQAVQVEHNAQRQYIIEQGLDPISLQQQDGGEFGGKRSAQARETRKKEIQAKIVQYELHHMDFEMDESMEEAEESGSSSELTKQQKMKQLHAKYQTYELQMSDRSILIEKDRRAHPLPAVSRSQLSTALNQPSVQSMLTTPAITSESMVSSLVTELELSFDGETCDVDLADLTKLEQSHLKFNSVKQVLMVLQLLNMDASTDEFEAVLARDQALSANSALRTFLTVNARSVVQERVIHEASKLKSSSAKYALLELEVERLELEELEEEGIDEIPVEFGAKHSKSLPQFAMSIEESNDVDEAILENESPEPIVIDELSSRLRTSSLLPPLPAHDTSLMPVTLEHIIKTMNLNFVDIDKQMLMDDLSAMEQQGGLKFKSVQSLLSAMCLLQDEGLEHNTEEFCAAANSKDYSPSIQRFLLQLYQSPARLEKIRDVRDRRSQRRAARKQMQEMEMARARAITRDDGDDVEEMKEEMVTVTSSALLRVVKQYDVLDLTECIMPVEADFQSLLLESSLVFLPEYCIEADLKQLSAKGVKLSHPKQVVQMLELIHQKADVDAKEVELIFSSKRSKKAANAAAGQYAQFVMDLRNENHGEIMEVIADSSSLRVRSNAVSASKFARIVTEADIQLDMSMQETEESPEDKKTRLASKLARMLRVSQLTSDRLSAEDVLRVCTELHFELDESSVDEMALMLERVPPSADGKQINLKPIIMSLQIIDESKGIERDFTLLEPTNPNQRANQLSGLPVAFAEYIQIRSDESQALQRKMVQRRKSKAQPQYAMSSSSYDAFSPSSASVVNQGGPVVMSLTQIEQEWNDVEWAEHSIDSTGGSRSASASIHSFCTEFDLNYSQVTIDELRVIKSHARAIPNMKQAVEILKLMQTNVEGKIDQDRLLTELEKLEKRQPASERMNRAQKSQTVRLLLDMEAEMADSMTLVEEQAGSPVPPLPPPPSSRQSKLPPPLPHHMSTMSSSTLSNPTPQNVMFHVNASSSSPPPPEWLSPPTFPYPPPSNLPPPLPPFPSAAGGVHAASSSSHHVRFHSHENELKPEKQYEALVEHIVELGLTKSPYSSISDLPVPVDQLNFTSLYQQVEEIQDFKRARGVRGAIYDTPAHCIRCLHSDILPPALIEVSPSGVTSMSLAMQVGIGRSSMASGTSLPSPSSNLLRHQTAPSSSAKVGHVPLDSYDSHAELIAHHIRHSSHFKQVREEDEMQQQQGSLRQISSSEQEVESSPPAACCGKGACTIM